MILSALFACFLALNIAKSFLHSSELIMTNIMLQMSRHLFRHRHKLSSKEDNIKSKANEPDETGNAQVAGLANADEKRRDNVQRAREGLDQDSDTAPPTGKQLDDEIERQGKLLQREYDMERMHRELIHIEVEKLHLARENQLMNRQFMAVLNERRELDRERKEMIAAAVEVWRELSGDENNFKSKKVYNLNDAISKALHRSSSVTKIKEEEPRLLKRLRMCKTEKEVRSFQADLKKKQEVLFQLLLKSETMVAMGIYYPHTKDCGTKDKSDTSKSYKTISPKTAVKRPRPNDSKASIRPVIEPPQPPNQESARNFQPIGMVDENAQPTNEERGHDQPTNVDRERTRQGNELTWKLNVRGIRETSI